ncbi:MAG: tripartite tricarboxylate transporter substrate binding protein [Desulfobacterales bacterium]|nr:tripartite tricarboxylate transporter substrate binding protein [Deltaproteobacteria bacterium]NNK93373.1 tripartite tricarboxylate transporter substrate binding protein [Desulfobacterales bacterium]
MYSLRRNLLVALLISFMLVCAFVAQPVFAADYPSRPIKMLTMVKPGAQIDLLARKVAEELKNELGQPVLVSNNPGGSHGSVMAAELSRAKPDGYTLGIGATAAYTYTPHYVKTNYKFEDFTFISKLGLNQSGVVCRPDRPWKTLGDAFAWAKKEGKGLTYMFQGSDDRDVLTRIAAKEGVKLSFMPSQGGPSIISAVLGGHADLGHLGAILFGYVPQKLTLLAASTPTRLVAPPQLKDFPDVPTLKEQGWDESVEMFIALIGPKGLPEATLAGLEEAMAKLADDEAFREFVAVKLKMGPVTYGRPYAEEYMMKAYDRFGAQAAGMKKK